MSYDKRVQRLSDDMSLLAEGEINPAQMANRAVGEAVGQAGDLLSGPLAGVQDVLENATPVGVLMDKLSPLIQEGIQHLWNGVKETGPAKAAAKFLEENPEAAREVSMGMNTMSLLPGGALKAAGRALRPYAPEASKGGILASASNYIDSHYAPDRAGSKLEKAVAGRTGLPEAGLVKATDGTGWGANTLLGAAEAALDPKARALWGEQGISTIGQRHIKKELGKQDTPYMKFGDVEGKHTRAREKGVSQAQYAHHIRQQVGREGNVHPVAKELEKRSFLQEATPMTPENVAQSMTSMAYKVDPENPKRPKKLDHNDPYWRTAESQTMQQKDAEFATKYIFQQQKPNGTAQFVVKNPTARESGGHFNDVVYKNPANEAVADVFKKHADENGNVDVFKLFDELEARKGPYNAKLKESGRNRDTWWVVNKDKNHVAENGLWLAGGKGGSAVTEGGVMWLQKLDPDGTTTSFMIDKHDFLEKGGKLNPLNSILENEMIAITPPMKGNIKSQRVIKRKGKNLKAPEWFQQAGKDKADWKGTNLLKEGGLLDQYANVQPSAQGVRAESLVNAGGISDLMALLAAGEDE